MKKALAIAMFALLLLAGCTSRSLMSGDLASNWAYCKDADKLKLKIERARCLHNLAVLNANEPEAVTICSEITLSVVDPVAAVFQWVDDAVVKNIRYDCYYEVAVKKAEHQAAEGITGLGTGSAIADICGNIKGDTDPNVDNEAGNMLLRDDCFEEVALITQDKNVCDRISPDVTLDRPVIDPSTNQPEYEPDGITVKIVKKTAIQNCKDQIP